LGSSINTEVLLRRGDVYGLMEALEDDDFTVRRDAAEALETLADERALEALIRSLRYEEWQEEYPVLTGVRAASARALGRIGNPKAVDHLIMALDDTDIDVKIAAIRSLSGFPEERVFEAIRRFIDHPDENVRKNAVWALIKLNPERGLRYASMALYDESWVVRKTAARSMIGVADEGYLDILIDKLGDPDSDVRRQALLAVVNIGEAAVKPLIQKLEDPSWQTRAMVAEALGEIGSKKAVKPLKGMLSGRKRDENRYVRGKVAEALGLIGDPEAVEALQRAAKDPYPFVRRKARAALDIIDAKPDLEVFDNGELRFRYPRFWDLSEASEDERLVEGSWDDNLEFVIKRKEVPEITAEEFSEVLFDVLVRKGFFNLSRDIIRIDNEHGYIMTGETKEKRVIVFVFKKKMNIYYIYFRGPLERIRDSYRYIRVFINTLHA